MVTRPLRWYGNASALTSLASSSVSPAAARYSIASSCCPCARHHEAARLLSVEGEPRLAPVQLGLEHLPEQMVVAEPAALVVEGDDEQVLALQLLEQLRGVVALEHRVAERGAHGLEDRRSDAGTRAAPAPSD